MSASFTDAKVHQWLEEIADEAWLSLHYDTPDLGGIGSCEIFGGGYQRQRVSFTKPANRTIWSLAEVRFTGLTENQLTHIGIWDDQYNGTLCASCPLPEKKIIVNGWGYVIPEGELALSLG